ncbi:unnamed protein product [Arabidopsis thaliana]|uniref:(thale cress) hypothetical protein n=1 Tax=Arabidopsis thaliana TaxID=3702 RepID=A0A7G2ETD7_ARATH|nr:unnamed protein product [Arabidopsis thaliana]
MAEFEPMGTPDATGPTEAEEANGRTTKVRHNRTGLRPNGLKRAREFAGTSQTEKVEITRETSSKGKEVVQEKEKEPRALPTLKSVIVDPWIGETDIEEEILKETDEENDEAGKGGENPTAIPSFGEMWDSMKTMMAQLAVITQAVLPAGMPSKGTDGRIRQAVTQSGNTVRNSTEVIEIDPPGGNPNNEKKMKLTNSTIRRNRREVGTNALSAERGTWANAGKQRGHVRGVAV